MKTTMPSRYNRQPVEFIKILDSFFIRKAAGPCRGDVIGQVEVNSEIGYMTVKLHEHGHKPAELTLYKPYKDRPKRINWFLVNNGYVLV